MLSRSNRDTLKLHINLEVETDYLTIIDYNDRFMILINAQWLC